MASTTPAAAAIAPAPSDDRYPVAPAPWTLHGDVYLFSWYTPASRARREPLPAHAYSPLEAASEYATHPLSRHVGGLATVQLIRYRDSPVGPYDELIVIPGLFEWARPDGVEGSGRIVTGANPKITRIYVSQPHTCHNGRTLWNVPKHLARFDWTSLPDGSTTVKVFPHDIPSHSNPSTSTSSIGDSPPAADAVPFFQSSFRPMRFVPSFPFSTHWTSYLGIDTTLVHPPLPRGKGSLGELPGTDRWCAIEPGQSSRNTTLGWFDMAQAKDEATGKVVGGGGAEGYENFWPRLGRWHIGVRMADAEITFGDPEHRWYSPKSNL